MHIQCVFPGTEKCLKCSLKGWGGYSNRQDVCAFLIKTLPTLLHSFTSHSSPHPCHASTLHLKHTHPKRNPTFMFHSSDVCLLLFHNSSTSVVFVVFFPPLSLSLCHVCCFFLYIKSYSFLFQCVSQSVCLSLSVWPSSWLSGCRWKVGSPSGRPHQADS